MILLGLLLMLACAALAVDAVVQNTGMMHATAFNQPVSHLSLGAIFVAGAVVGLLFTLGLIMAVSGVGRRGRKRRARRDTVADTQAENAALREHNERLSARLADDPAAATYPAEDGTDASRLTARHRAG